MCGSFKKCTGDDPNDESKCEQERCTKEKTCEPYFGIPDNCPSNHY